MISTDFDTVRKSLTAETDGFCAWCQISIHEVPHDPECLGVEANAALARIRAEHEQLGNALVREQARPGGSWDEAAFAQLQAEIEWLQGERDADEGRITLYEQARRELGLPAVNNNDFDIVRDWIAWLKKSRRARASMVAPAHLRGTRGDDAFDRIRAENESLRLRDKMRADGEQHLLGEIEARDKEIERLRRALRHIEAQPNSPGAATYMRVAARAALGEQP